MLSKEELSRYSRHILLPEFGLAGQEKLKEAKVLVIGAGGLGCPVLLYLAAAGVGEIGIVDDDTVDESNLQRQVLYTVDDIGKPKAEAAAHRLTRLNPHIKINIHKIRLNNSNALDVLAAYDVIADGSDNFATRYLVNDACVLLGKPLVFGAVHRFEGQASVFNAEQKDGQRGPTYRCAFPLPPSPEESPSCAEAGVLGVLPGLIGTIQASEVIRIISGMGETISGRLLLVDALSMDFLTLHIKRTDHEGPANREEFLEMNYDFFCSSKTGSRAISTEELQELLSGKENIQLLDVRERGEAPMIKELAGFNIPLGELESQAHLISKEKKVIVFCRSGARSSRAINLLQKKFGLTNLYNLEGGVNAWLERQQEPVK